MKELVSVIIPTYGRPKTLERAIKSVLGQTYVNIEIIVVDDNDPDTEERAQTMDVMNSFSDGRIKYLKHPQNLNGAAARNTGIKFATGSYISFLDDDDEYEPEKIAHQLQFILTHKQYGVVYCLASNFKNNNLYYQTKYHKTGNLQYDILAMQHELYTPSLFIDIKLIKKINGFDEKFRRHQDYDLLLRLNDHSELACLDEYLVKIHNDDVINQPDVENYIKNKKLFLDTFGPYILRHDKKKQRTIYSIHYFDIFYYALKRHKFFVSLHYLLKSRPGLSTLDFAIKKFRKIKSRKG